MHATNSKIGRRFLWVILFVLLVVAWACLMLLSAKVFYDGMHPRGHDGAAQQG